MAMEEVAITYCILEELVMDTVDSGLKWRYYWYSRHIDCTIVLV